MYKFTSGIVVFDETTKNNLIKAGHRLVATGGIVETNKLFDESIISKNEAFDENSTNDGIVEEKSRRIKKVSK